MLLVVCLDSREPNSWDQALFNEELFYPSHPGYETMDQEIQDLDH